MKNVLITITGKLTAVGNQQKKMDKEIHHKTEFVSKDLPTIVYEKNDIEDMTKQYHTYLKVSDENSEKALETFKKVKKELNI